MTNKVEEIFEDIAKVVEWPFQALPKANKIIGAALADSPELQTAVTSLISKIEAQAGDITAAVAAGGLNFDADAAAVAQAQELYSYVTGTFIPTVKKAIDDVETAAGKAPAAAAPAAATKAPKATKPAATAAASTAPAVETAAHNEGSEPTN